jgi:membrane protein implicated in regulation of membrane protease activity
MIEMSLIKAFLEHASAQGSRSTVLKPIGWMMPICVAGVLTSLYLGAPNWLIVMFAIFSGLTMVLYLGSYTYCLLTDKEALRSETYSIQKLAIEKGFVGDSIVGKLKAEVSDEGRLIEAGELVESEDDK